MQIPLELTEQLQKGNVVLFCGAGISTSPDGLPTGGQLAQELAERAGLEHKELSTVESIKVVSPNVQ